MFSAARFPRTGFPRSKKASAIRPSAAILPASRSSDFRASLYDGKYHDVDSSDMAFKIAGSLAFKEAMKQARPALLEPIMHVEVYAPDQYSGDLMGHLSGRRGKISGSERARASVVDQSAGSAFGNAELRERTDLDDARPRKLLDGIFALRFRPEELAEKVIAAHKPHHAAEEGEAASA